MFQMTLNKHAKFHGDRTIGDAITGKKASKHSISKVNDLKSMQYYSLDSLVRGSCTKCRIPIVIVKIFIIIIIIRGSCMKCRIPIVIVKIFFIIIIIPP